MGDGASAIQVVVKDQKIIDTLQRLYGQDTAVTITNFEMSEGAVTTDTDYTEFNFDDEVQIYLSLLNTLVITLK